jgi:hypothetical protein
MCLSYVRPPAQSDIFGLVRTSWAPLRPSWLWYVSFPFLFHFAAAIVTYPVPCLYSCADAEGLAKANIVESIVRFFFLQASPSSFDLNVILDTRNLQLVHRLLFSS